MPAHRCASPGRGRPERFRRQLAQSFPGLIKRVALTGRPALSGRLPVALGPEFDVARAQVLTPEIVERGELALAARVVKPPDREPAARPVDQSEEPPGGQRLGD